MKENKPAKYFIMSDDFIGKKEVDLDGNYGKKDVVHLGKNQYQIENIVIADSYNGVIILECKLDNR